MKFWDSSAILALIAAQPGSEDLKAVFASDAGLVLWWGTRVELASGLCRLRREGRVDDSTLSSLLKAVELVANEADEVQPSDKLRLAAVRALRVHDLRAADSLQLAAALAWTDHDPVGAAFVCLDKRLREAAEKEGFQILPA